MSRPDLYAAVKRLYGTAGHFPANDRSDRELLDRFASERDEAAFAAIVRRHGRLVLSTCRRVLRHDADAEDAFQATFLVLARKPQAVRSGGSAAPWLYAVALRLAAKLKADARRRRDCERAVPPRPSTPTSDPTLREVEAALDEELGSLPDRLRAPLILCYLEARTQDEAARELGWSLRTLQRRLEEGRRRLHARLVRRGFSLPAALVAAGLMQSESAAAVPADVVATARAAVAFAAGREAGIPARAIALARTGLGGTLVSRWSAVAALAILLGGVTGVGAFALHATADPESRSAEVDDAERSAFGQRAAAAARDGFGDLLPERAVVRLGTVRFNHGRGLGALLFAPDGKTIFSRSRETIRAWSVATGEELFHLSGPTGGFVDRAAAVTPDGKQLITLEQESGSDTLRFVDLVARKEVKKLSLPVKRNVVSIFRRNALSPDGRRCALHTNTDVRVFDTATGTQLWKLSRGGDDIQALAFAGNDRVVTAHKGHNVEVWEAATGGPVRNFNAGSPVGTVAASADGRWLVTLDHHTDPVNGNPQDDAASLWDLATGLKRGTLPAGPKRRFTEVKLTRDGRHVHASLTGGTGGGPEWRVWDTEDPGRSRTFNAFGFTHLAISADGNTLAEGTDSGKFELWNFRSGRRVSCGDGRAAEAEGVSVVGDRVVIAGRGAAVVWSGVTGRRLRSIDLPGFPIRYPTRCLSPDGRLVLSFDGNWEVHGAVVLDVDTGRPLYAPEFDPTSAFSSGLFASWGWDAKSQGAVVRLREARTGKEVRTFPAKNANWPGRLSFTAEGKTLFVAGRRIVAYEIATGKELYSWRLPPPVDDGVRVEVGGRAEVSEDRMWWLAQAVSPSGALAAFILIGGRSQVGPFANRIVLADATTGRVLRRWSDSGIATGQLERLEFSPDGRQLASSDDTVIRLWEVATGKEIRTFRGHRSNIAALAFGADGRRLASAGYESVTLLWDLTAGPRRTGVTDKEVAVWWADLAGDDATRADEAAWRLADVPGPTVALLRRHLRPVTTADMRVVRARIAELDSDSFAVREKATADLERFGFNAVPLLQRSLREGPTPEAKRRVTQLLEKLAPFPAAGEPLRTWRALAVLEHAGTAEATNLLESLAGGDPDAWLTRESKAALRRIGQAGRATP